MYFSRGLKSLSASWRIVERQGNHREVTPEESEVTKNSLSLVMRKEADNELAGVSERSCPDESLNGCLELKII